MSPRAITLTLLAILRTSILLTAFSCGIYTFLRHGVFRFVKSGSDMAKAVGAATTAIAATCLLLSSVGETGDVMRFLHNCDTASAEHASSCMSLGLWMITTGVITESLVGVALPLNVATLTL